MGVVCALQDVPAVPVPAVTEPNFANPGATPADAWRERVAAVARCVPGLLPGHWQEVEVRLDGRAYRNDRQGLRVIWSVAREQDGRLWQHVSVSHRARLPTWDELVRVKEWLIGRDVDAYQVLPARERWVNLHPHVLHLWRCLDGDPLPDFTAGSGQI